MVFAFCLGFIFTTAGGQDLRTVAAVRELNVEQTQRKIPVHLHGVITFFDERLFSRFLQDETAGIYLQFPGNMPVPALQAGQLVEVTGASSPGEYAPVVMVDSVRALGTAPLPAPSAVTYEQLASGVYADSQLIEITGIVRSASAGRGFAIYT